MKLTSIEARRYRLPLDPPFHAAWDPEPRRSFAETIVVVQTDAGVTGYAGGAAVPDLGLISDLLVGRDLSGIGDVFSVLETVDFHGGRNWTVEVAVQDAAARAAGLPLWALLGGERSRFDAYASAGQRLSVARRVDRVLEWRASGIRAVKLRFHRSNWRDDVAMVAAVRDAVGGDMDIMVDANHGWRMPGDLAEPWDLETALSCARALAELGVYWLEEPLPMHEVEDLARLRDEVGIRVAGGEMVRSLPETKRLVDAGAVDVVQNDAVLAGGVFGARQVAGWAHAAGLEWSPHTWTTGLGMLANLHAALAFSTAAYLEVPFDPPEWTPRRRDFMLPVPIEIGPDGTIAPPDGPGLGVEPDFDELERFRVG